MTATVFLALELGSTRWKLAFAVTRASRPRLRTVPAGDLAALWREMAAAKQRFALEPDTPVRSCYEAGRDGFWLHRALSAHGISNVVVDPSSIAVDRRQRRVKTDRDRCLETGDATDECRGRRSARVARGPGAVGRGRSRSAPAAGMGNRPGGSEADSESDAGLARHARASGVPLTAGFAARLATVRVWDGGELPAALIARLEREWIQLQQVEARQTVLRRARTTRVQTRSDTVAHQTRQLAQLCGVATNGALTLTTELFAWRGFTNGRQIGAIVGLTPTPYRSDQTVVEQGISRSGQSARPRAEHRARLGVAAVSADQCAQSVVPTAVWPAWARPAHRDCGAGAQAADCLLALSGPGRAAGGRPGEGVTDARSGNGSDGAGARRSWRVRVSPRGPPVRQRERRAPAVVLRRTRMKDRVLAIIATRIEGGSTRQYLATCNDWPARVVHMGVAATAASAVLVA